MQASSRAGRVIETPLNRRLIHGAKPWRGAQRVVMPADAPAAVQAPQPVLTSTAVSPVDELEY